MDILLADNTPLYHEIFQRILGKYPNFNLMFVSSVSEFREITAQKKFDFYVIASQIKEGSGLALAKSLRQSGQVPYEPIALLTSSASHEMAREARDAGVTEIFRRQDVEELVIFIRRFLSIYSPIPCRAIYVEDSRDQRLLLTSQLTEWGISVDAHDNADTAWEAFNNSDYDLVICDIVLGGHMSGSRFINRIRRLSGAKGQIAILAATAFDHPARRIELFHLGIDDYVVKPILPMELRARIQNLMTRKRATDLNEKLLAATSLAILTIQPKGIIQSVNENAELLMAAAAPLVGRDIRDFLPKYRPGEIVHRVSYTLTRQTDESLPIELTTVLVTGEAGEVCYALLIKDLR